MATIDELNFKVILNDADFEKRVKADIKLAKDLNTSLTNILNTKKSLNSGGGIKVFSQSSVNDAKSVAKQVKDIRDNMGKIPSSLPNASGALNGVAKSAENATKKVGGLFGTWTRLTSAISSVIFTVRMFTRTLGAAIKNIASFQQANANLATIMQVSRKEIEVLTSDALMLGRTTEWTASQVTELQTALAKLGYDIPQIRNMQASVLQFATAVGANLPDAANLAGAALRMFGMHSTETKKALEILTAATNKSALDFEKLKVSMPYVGAIAKSIGFDIAQTSAMLGVLTNSGLESSRAGTGLRQVLLELSKSGSKLQNAMGGNIKTFDDFVRGLENLRDRGFEAGEATKLVTSRASVALLTLANGVDDIKRLNDEVRDTDGLLKTIQEERLDTLHGSTLLLKSAWEGLIQTFRNSAGPMKAVVDELRAMVTYTSLLVSKNNRVKQGTIDVVGSDDLTNKYKQIFEEYASNGLDVAASIVEKKIEEDLAEAAKTKHGFFKILEYKSTFGLNANISRDQQAAYENARDAIRDYIASRIKEDAEIKASYYKELWQSIFDAEGEKAVRKAMAEVSGFDSIKKQMEVYIAAKKSGQYNNIDQSVISEEEKARQQFIEDLKNEAKYIGEVQDAIEKLEPHFGAETNIKIAEIFGEGDYSKDALEKQIEDIVAALRNLGKDGNDAADAIEQRFGLGVVNKLVKQQKALKKWLDTFNSWMKDYGGDYSGIEHDIDRIRMEKMNADKKADDEYAESVRQLTEARKGNWKAMTAELAVLIQLNQRRKEANRISAQEKLNDLASKYVKEKTSGLNMKDWGDKSIGQVRTLYQTLKALANGSVEIDAKLRKELTDAGLSIEDFTTFTSAKFKELSDEAKKELVKKMMASLKSVSSDVSDTLKKFGEVADAYGKGDLAQFFNDTAESIEVFASAAAKIAAGDEIGGAVELVSWYINSIIELVSAQAELKKSIRETAEEARRSSFSDALANGVESIFGSNQVRSAKNAAEVAKAAKALADADKQMSSQSMQTSKNAKWWEFLFSPTTTMAWIKTITKSSDSLAGMAGKLGMDLYDKYGNLNAETLKAILSTYKNLSQADQEWIQQAINNAEAYTEAMNQLEDVVKSIFGDVASSAADKIVDGWINAGNAALDYADILDDVAKKYAKMMIESAILDTILDEDKARGIVEKFVAGDAAGAMAQIEADMQAIAGMAPVFEKILESIDPYLNRTGTGTDSLKEGISKALVEQNATLLASYINAMRADLSVVRGLQAIGWQDVKSIREAVQGGASPNYNEYMAQIAADTHDMALRQQVMLEKVSKLASVVATSGNGGSAIRTMK